MPRQSRGPAPAPRRPTAPAPAPRPAPTQQQTRSASSVARPGQQLPQQQQAAPPTAGSQGSGLFGQMASTAAGVAVGSSIGHAIGGFFGGGSSQAAAQQDPALSQAQDYSASNPSGVQQQSQYTGSRACETDFNNFRRCMDENEGNMSICSWYVDRLKACQQAASQY